MKKEDKEELKKWCNHLEFYDQDEDGIGVIIASFKIRDEEDNMRRMFSEMTHEDAMEIMSFFIDSITYPCEEYELDWKDDDSGFYCDFGWNEKNGEICMKSEFRTC